MSAELPHSWNINLTILEPGGLRTNCFAGAVTTPQHPAYSDLNSPSSKWRAFWANYKPMGDPDKCAEAIIRISNLEKAPLRVPLGVDAYTIVGGECNRVIKQLEECKDISLSTLADDAGDMGEILPKISG